MKTQFELLSHLNEGIMSGESLKLVWGCDKRKTRELRDFGSNFFGKTFTCVKASSDSRTAGSQHVHTRKGYLDTLNGCKNETNLMHAAKHATVNMDYQLFDQFILCCKINLQRPIRLTQVVFRIDLTRRRQSYNQI